MATTYPIPVSAPAPALRKPNFAVVLAMLALASVLSLYFSFRPDPQAAAADVTKLPMSVGAWQSPGDAQLDPETMKQILADSYVSRRYENAQTGQSVELLVVYRRFGRREFAHRPELCFPAAGYSITKKDRTTLPYAGRDAEAVYLLADGSSLGEPPTTITYLFASGKKTECDFIRQQIWMAFERVVPNKNGWTFVRLTSKRVTTDADALAAQKDFLRTLGPDLERVITTNETAKS